MSSLLGSGRIRSQVLRDFAGPLVVLLLAFAVSGEAAAQRGPRGAAPEAASGPAAHAKVLEEDRYPSASKCGSCHQQIYDEWRVSNHAYAGISPMFHKFEQKITELAPTIGTFCVRCHMSVGTTLNEARELPLWKRSQVSREGVTCVSCHRVNEEYGKANGERRIVPGTIHDAVNGPFGGAGVASVVQNAARYNVAVDDKGRGTKIHTTGRQVRATLEVRILHVLPPGRGQPRHQA